MFHVYPKKTTARVHQVLQTASRFCSLPGLLKTSGLQHRKHRSSIVSWLSSDPSHSHQDSRGHSLGPVVVAKQTKHIKKTTQIRSQHTILCSLLYCTYTLLWKSQCCHDVEILYQVDVPLLGIGEQRMLPPCRFPELLHVPINPWTTQIAVLDCSKKMLLPYVSKTNKRVQ